MTSSHGMVQVYAGAKWEFHGKLFDSNGAPMDITSKSVEWRLLNKYQQPVLNNSGDVTVTKTNAVQGLISIIVEEDRSALVPVGRYTDYLRVNGEDIMWTGQIIVVASPFGGIHHLFAPAVSAGAPFIGTPGP